MSLSTPIRILHAAYKIRCDSYHIKKVKPVTWMRSIFKSVTVAVEGMKFIKPVHVGDVVCCYGQVDSIGNTSVALKLEVWVKPVLPRGGEERFKVTEGRFIYVAIDDQHNKRRIPRP